MNQVSNLLARLDLWKFGCDAKMFDLADLNALRAEISTSDIFIKPQETKETH